MSQNKKELVLAALNNLPVDRVPVGFWFHFADESDHLRGLEDPAVLLTNIEGHKAFYSEFKPDFVKVMSDGYFGYPNEELRNVRSAADLKGITPIGEDHPWIVQQVNLVKKVSEILGGEVLYFYNIFSPLTSFRLLQDGNGHEKIARLISEDKESFKHALDVIGHDLGVLSKKVITEAGASGIYLSVQNVQDASVTEDIYKDVIAPSELSLISTANEASANNILHICGYEGSRNDITWYRDYPVRAFNWAVNVEGVSLADGKRIFGGRAVIGGFDNTRNGILYKGTKEEVQAFTEGLIKGAGRTGVILGADCTVPSDISIERLNWVRDRAASL